MAFSLCAIFQWNGKDLFLQDEKGDFTVKSFSELTNDTRVILDRDKKAGVTTRKARLYGDGHVELERTAAELEEERVQKGRIAKLYADIAAFEASSENAPAYVKAKLTMLRAELGSLIPMDPTCKTLEQQRANESIKNWDELKLKGRK